MPTLAPFRSSGGASKRVRPLPAKVRAAVRFMVWGNPNDENYVALNFIRAANLAGVKPDQMRRWLDKPQVRSLIATERKRLRAAIIAGNEGVLKEIRDESKNDMARIAAVRLLGEIEDGEETRSPTGLTGTPGVTINIINGNQTPNAFDASRTIPAPYVTVRAGEEEEPEPETDPIFKP